MIAIPATIRRARPEDGPTVRRIVFETLEAYGIILEPDGHDRDVMTFGANPDTIDEFVADVSGVTVGSVMLAPLEGGAGWLSKFFVETSYRGRGIGRALLERAVQAGRDRGYRRLDLDTRTFFEEATHLYESTGWKRSARSPELGPCNVLYSLELILPSR